jgi:fructuronate reductase
MVFVYRGRDVAGRPLVLDDPLADALREAAAGPEGGLAGRLLAVREIFPAEIAEHPGFRAAVDDAVRRLLSEVP